VIGIWQLAYFFVGITLGFLLARHQARQRIEQAQADLASATKMRNSAMFILAGIEERTKRLKQQNRSSQS
jgi:UPF0716 family protein affecting phage T7 exclusion